MNQFVKLMIKQSRKLVRFSTKNSNWILAILATLGVGGTAYSVASATIKAVKLCEEKQVKGGKEVLRTVWKLYIPSAGCVIATTICILGNAHINGKRLATLTGLYAASKADFQAFKEKAQEVLGENKTQKIQNAADAKLIEANPPKPENIVETGHGNQLYQFKWTGQYFRASNDYIDLIFADLNKQIDDDLSNECSVDYLIDRLGLPEADAGRAAWHKVDILHDGYKEVKANVQQVKWVNVTGQEETCAMLRFEPEPSEFI